MYGVVIAFKDFRPSKGIWGSAWVGLKHFLRFLQFPGFETIFFNTLRISLYSIASFPCAIVLALMIHELDSRRFKQIVQTVTYAPHFISTVVMCAMIILFLGKSSGIVNALIAAMGGERVDFMAHSEYFAGIYVITDIWQHVGWGTIVYLAALSGASPELREAARIDGANRFQIVWHINLPCILPTIVIMLIMRCGSILSVGFEKTYLLQNSLNLDASQVISTYVYELGLQSAQYSYSTAIGLFNNSINVACILIVNSICRRLSGIGLW